MITWQSLESGRSITPHPSVVQLLSTHVLRADVEHDDLDRDSCRCARLRQPAGAFDGETCPHCGGMTQRTGSCRTCTTCGSTTGCG